MGETFRLRGLKGLWWEPPDYLDWPPLLASAGYNFFMICYTFCPETSLRWRQPFRTDEAAILRRLAADCGARDIELCLAINPCIGQQAWAPHRAGVRFHPVSGPGWFLRYWRDRRPAECLLADPALHYDAAADLVALVAKCNAALALGVRTFALCLDDIEPEGEAASGDILGARQAWLARALLAALRRTDPGVRLFLAPTYYWSGGMRTHPGYVSALVRVLPPEIAIFWTGEEVRSAEITSAQAREAAAQLGRQPVVWYNYASNDAFQFALQLPPARPPHADLRGEVGGFMVNPMRQVHLTRLHALVMGEYLADPVAYCHTRAAQEAVRRIAGEAAGPSLERFINAWAAYPDPRRLADLLADHAGLVALAAALNRSAAILDETLPQLDRLLADRRLCGELVAGTRRFDLLTEAVALRRAAHDHTDPAPEAHRARLERALAAAGEELASDARAVLAL